MKIPGVKMTGYQVLHGGPEYVAEQVIKLCNEGWELFGRPHFEPYHPPVYPQGTGGGGGGNPGPTLYQTMVRYEWEVSPATGKPIC